MLLISEAHVEIIIHNHTEYAPVNSKWINLIWQIRYPKQETSIDSGMTRCFSNLHNFLSIEVDTCCAFTSRAACDKYPCIQARVSYVSSQGHNINNVIVHYDFQSAEFQGDNASVSATLCFMLCKIVITSSQFPAGEFSDKVKLLPIKYSFRRWCKATNLLSFR